MTEDEQIALAIQMSMSESTDQSEGTKTGTPTAMESEVKHFSSFRVLLFFLVRVTSKLENLKRFLKNLDISKLGQK